MKNNNNFIKINHTPENVKRLRIADGLTLKKCANIFGISLRGWQKKEEYNSVNNRGITKGEYIYFLLLAEEHPEFTLKKQNDKENRDLKSSI